jgi:hypothetical protein
MRGLDPRIHHKNQLREEMDCRVARAFTPVFDGLSPAMTTEPAASHLRIFSRRYYCGPSHGHRFPMA